MISAPTEKERAVTVMAEYIDLEALRDALYDADAITMNGVKILNQFPSADVAQVRHGRWGSNGIPDSMLSACSVCGFGCGAYSFQYCPNCGARMDALSNLAELEDAERSRRIESLLKKGVTGW